MWTPKNMKWMELEPTKLWKLETTKLWKAPQFQWRARREQERKAEEVLRYLQTFNNEDSKIAFRKSENGGWSCTIMFYNDNTESTGDWCDFAPFLTDDVTESTYEQSESSLYFMDGALQWSMDECDSSTEESSVDVYYFDGALQLSIPTDLQA